MRLKPFSLTALYLLRAALGLGILILVMAASTYARQLLRLALPGPVLGLALLASMVLLGERWQARWHQPLVAQLAPVSRRLVAHLSLLFVPAGVGIITEGEALRQAWLPLLAGVLVSTLLGLAATGWCLHRGSPPARAPKA